MSSVDCLVPDASFPPWALRPELGDLLEQAGASDVVFVQRRRDGVVLVGVVPLAALRPELVALLERGRAHEPLGALQARRFRRWLLALDVDGTARVVEAMGAIGPRGLA